MNKKLNDQKVYSYVCSFCGKQIVSKELLVFRCSICNKNFCADHVRHTVHEPFPELTLFEKTVNWIKNLFKK